MSNAYFGLANLSLCYSRYFSDALFFLEVLDVKGLGFFGWPLVKGLGEKTSGNKSPCAKMAVEWMSLK